MDSFTGPPSVGLNTYNTYPQLVSYLPEEDKADSLISRKGNVSNGHRNRTPTNSLASPSPKKRVPWNKGKKLPSLSKEHREKISKGNKGKKRSVEFRKNLSILKSKHLDLDVGILRRWYIDERKSARIIAKMLEVDTCSILSWLKEFGIPIRTISEIQRYKWRGENNPNWIGGRERYYGEDWCYQKRQVLILDEYKCQFCHSYGKGRDCDVHHIIPYRIVKDNRLINLISLCQSCHIPQDMVYKKLEKFYNEIGW